MFGLGVELSVCTASEVYIGFGARVRVRVGAKVRSKDLLER